MKILLLISIFMISSIASSNEVTNPAPGEFDNEITSSAGKNKCILRVSNSVYRVRRAPNNGPKCGVTLKSSGVTQIEPLGMDGNWIKFSHPSCKGGVGYVFHKAFRYEDRQVYSSGRCGRALYGGYRNPPKAPKADTSTSVSRKGSNKHRFPMDKCRGIRSDGYGSGYYDACRSRIKGTNRCRRSHKGCDYKAPSGTPLKSPCKGRVSVSSYLKVAGDTVKIHCDNGDRFTMMHLKHGSRIRAGTRVGVGTQVGRVGKTGNANVRAMQTHLHIEAIIKGRRVDPMSLWNCR